MNLEKTLNRQSKLADLIVKNQNAWFNAIDSGRNPSARLTGWAHEFDSNREEVVNHNMEAWENFCQERGMDFNATSADLLA